MAIETPAGVRALLGMTEQGEVVLLRARTPYRVKPYLRKKRSSSLLVKLMLGPTATASSLSVGVSSPLASLFGVVAVLALHVADVSLRTRGRRAFVRASGRSPAAWGITYWASKLAGRRRDTSQWRAHLAGEPESGVTLTLSEQRRHALGFLVAAVRYRLHDVLGEVWRPVDWMLSSRTRREAFIGIPPGLLVIYIAHHDGLHTLVTEGWGWVGGCGLAMFAFTRWLERIRGIELSDRSTTDDS
jgi:hypothetical protein